MIVMALHLAIHVSTSGMADQFHLQRRNLLWLELDGLLRYLQRAT